MSVFLAQNSYGKSRVRLVKVERGEGRHDVFDLTVDVALEGDFETAHTEGDNSLLYATDTMKNSVYALARQGPVDPPEAFALRLARHFLERVPHAGRVHVSIAQHPWDRIQADGGAHPTAFRRAGEERRLARVSATREAVGVEAGVEEMTVLKTAQSGFEGFMRDDLTTLRETADRLFATAVRATWRFNRDDVDWNASWTASRQALLATFATHDSLSVQHTLFAMGQAVLEARAEVDEVSLSLPNKHHLLVDLAPFGLDNPNEVFISTTEPFGLIEATVVREADLY
ncbi:MAG: putative uricase [Gemmatimonadetes bacterium]|nr:putative uricase [Gemmatimonadota bacterium]